MNSVHLHLMLNHVPVIGTALALLLLVVALFRRSEELKKAALWGFVLAAAFAVPVYLTGEPAEEKVEHLPGFVESVIERHEDSAQTAFTLVSIVGGVAAAGLAFLRAKPVPAWFATSVLTLAVVAGGMLAWTANLGGKIRHTEITAKGSPTVANRH